MALISVVPSVDPVSSALPGVSRSPYSTEIFSVVWQWDDSVQLLKKKSYDIKIIDLLGLIGINRINNGMSSKGS